MFFRFLAVFQVQEVDRKVEEIKAVISVYCSFKSVFKRLYMSKSVNTPTCNFAPMLCWHFRVILLGFLG